MDFSQACDSSAYQMSKADIRDKTEYLKTNDIAQAHNWALIRMNYMYGETKTDTINKDEVNKLVDDLIKRYPHAVKRIDDYSDHYVLIRIYDRDGETIKPFDELYNVIDGLEQQSFCLDESRLEREEAEEFEEWLLGEVKHKLRDGIDANKAIWKVYDWISHFDSGAFIREEDQQICSTSYIDMAIYALDMYDENELDEDEHTTGFSYAKKERQWIPDIGYDKERIKVYDLKTNEVIGVVAGDYEWGEKEEAARSLSLAHKYHYVGHAGWSL